MRSFILASQSPRRIEMLSKYISNLKVISSDIDEKVDADESPSTCVMRLSFLKAQSILDKFDDEIIIAADTIVYLDRIIGKPVNYDDAYNIIKHLNNKKHQVYTGICIIDAKNNKKILDYDVTDVYFNNLTDEGIRAYLDKKEYVDKAAGYGIQGFGELLVNKIDGCYNNVKGLPLNKVNKLMNRHFSIDLMNL